MSVRKVYQLLLDGHVVASGSYSSILACYDSVSKSLELLYGNLEGHTLVIAFSPIMKGDTK